MTDSATPRFALPLLFAGQAQKEITHNEALILIDALITAEIQGANINAPPASPLPGQCWAIGHSPSGVWLGKAGQLAIATVGGWRFCDVGEGFAVRMTSGGAMWRRTGATWGGPPTLAPPNGGTVIDSEARVAIAGLRAAMVTSGQITGD